MTSQHDSAILYSNGNIHCFDREHRVVEALAVLKGRIVATGSREDVLRDIESDHVEIDLQGCHVVPGFIDAHCHFAVGAFSPLWHDCSAGIVKTLDQEISRGGDGWIRGRQPPHWGTHPSIAELDVIAPDRPLIVVEQGYHGCFLNSRALLALQQSCGGDRFSALLEGKETHGRTTLTNLPTTEAQPSFQSAAVFESAMGWAENVTRDWFQVVHASSMPDLVERRSQEFIDQGVTTICDAALTPMLELLLEQALRLGRLPLHVVGLGVGRDGFFAPPWDRLDTQSFEADKPLRKVGLKLFIDGGRQCLIELPNGETIGHRYYGHSELVSLMEAASQRGLATACHVMGNQAIREAVAAFSEAHGARSGVLRLEHAAIINAQAVDAMVRAGASAIVQPHWIATLGGRWLEHPYPGLKFLPLRLLRDAGLTLAGSSDATDSPPVPPLQSIRAAVFRSTGEHVLDEEQCLSPYEALEMFTSGAATVCGVQDRKGSLLPGYDADFVILDGDPLSRQFLWSDAVRVLTTVIGGVPRS